MRRNQRRMMFAICALLLCAFPASLHAAQPVTITFEDINNKPFGWDLLPAFSWRGVLFSGGGLHRSDTLGTWYMARAKNSIEMVFPSGSTDISFDVDGRGDAYFPQPPDQFLPIQVWNGQVGIGVLVQTLPIPSPFWAILPPKHKVTISGPLSKVSIFTTPKPPGAYDYTNLIAIDNVRYTPPDPEPTITFDAVLPAHARVLTHNYGDYPYPSALQTEDGAIRVNATVTLGGQPAAGKTIHFRIQDPADIAPYVIQAGDDELGDNFDGPGSLNGTGQPSATAVSDASGRVSITLRTTSFAAGDNYQIEASSKPDFPCALTCPKSAVYTAWKRVYVEYNKMFRRGAFLARPVPAGAKEIPVADVDSLPAPPFEIRVLHASRVDAPSADLATDELIAKKREAPRRRQNPAEGPPMRKDRERARPEDKGGVLGEYGLSEEQGNEIIMAARAHWFEDEAPAQTEEAADADSSQ